MKTKVVEEFFQSSIKQSVIVQAPVVGEDFVELASTSTKRNNLKRRHPPPEAESTKAASDSSFSKLQSLVPGLTDNSPIKISKAAQLMKAADHIHQLKTENDSIQVIKAIFSLRLKFSDQNEVNLLKSSSEDLLKDILSCQSQLSSPGNGKLFKYHIICRPLLITPEQGL